MPADTHADPQRTFYVAPTGDDSHPGTEAEPFRTIQKAADRARAGDTILVRAGVYAEAVVLQFSGQEGKPIVLSNYPGERPVIQPGERGKEPPGQGVRLEAREGYQKPIGWITIQGFEIRYGWDGIKLYNAHDVVIRDNHILANYHQGILGNGNRVRIEGNIVAENGTNAQEAPNQMHGIYGTGTAFTIVNNIVHSNSAYGIQVAAYGFNPSRHAGPEFSGARDWVIANNTIAFNKHRSGVVIWQDKAENCTVQNNIFYKNGGGGITFYSQGGKRHPVQNNIFFPAGRMFTSPEPEAYLASDNQEIDPRLVDPDAFDFGLRLGSPAIDAGLGDRAPVIDLEGTKRPHGARVDIGAYESRRGDGGEDDVGKGGDGEEEQAAKTRRQRLILVGAVVVIIVLAVLILR